MFGWLAGELTHHDNVSEAILADLLQQFLDGLQVPPSAQRIAAPDRHHIGALALRSQQSPQVLTQFDTPNPAVLLLCDLQ